jgi:hypothetical protein
MGGGVALAMGIAGAPRNHALQRGADVGDDVRVGMLVDCDARRGMRHENRDRSVRAAEFGERFLHRSGNVNKSVRLPV